MVSLLRKLIPDDDDRRLFSAMVVVAANAGVWTPIEILLPPCCGLTTSSLLFPLFLNFSSVVRVPCCVLAFPRAPGQGGRKSRVVAGSHSSVT
jgi:hypothetical protein